MIPPTTQIVQNDIFVKEMNSDHDHLRCICDTPKVKKPKTTHLEDILLPQPSILIIILNDVCNEVYLGAKDWCQVELRKRGFGESPVSLQISSFDGQRSNEL